MQIEVYGSVIRVAEREFRRERYRLESAVPAPGHEVALDGSAQFVAAPAKLKACPPSGGVRNEFPHYWGHLSGLQIESRAARCGNKPASQMRFFQFVPRR